MKTRLTPSTWTIYQLRNKLTGHLYIGQTVQTLNDRWKRHCSLAKAGHRSILAASIQEFGAEHFEGVELVQVRTQAEADEWETLLIAAHPRSALYNEQTGGRYSAGFSPLVEEKRRAGLRGKKRPDAAARLREAWAKRDPGERSRRAQLMVEGRRAKAAARNGES